MLLEDRGQVSFGNIIGKGAVPENDSGITGRRQRLVPSDDPERQCLYFGCRDLFSHAGKKGAHADAVDNFPGNCFLLHRQRQVEPFIIALQWLTKKSDATVKVSSLEEFRWLIEEFKVSLFAQELGTSVPVSAKRLSDQLASLQSN